jgi:hypothetical protein
MHKFRTEQRGGGSAIYIHNDLEFSFIDKSIFENNTMEIVGAIIKLPNQKNITILSVYVPPSKTFSLSQLNKLITTDQILILGDFNAKNKLWGSPKNDPKGITIEKFINHNNLVVLNKGEGTRINPNSSLSHLDIALCSHKLSPTFNLEIGHDTWGSDHYPLIISFLNNNYTNFQPNNSMIDISKADWKLFESILEKDPIFSNKASSNLLEYDNFISAILNAVELSIPLKSEKPKHKYTPFWNKKCSQEKLEKKNAEKTFRKKQQYGQLH